MEDHENKVNLFFIYSRKDAELRKRLEIHLHSLKRKNYINLWHDGEIIPGQDWQKQISIALSKADIILILVSVDFIASDYCYEIEMTKALERHKLGEVVIVPIILKDCDWHDTPIGELQALPSNGDPIIGGNWKDPESGFRDTVVRLKQLIEERIRNKETIRKQSLQTITNLELMCNELKIKNKKLTNEQRKIKAENKINKNELKIINRQYLELQKEFKMKVFELDKYIEDINTTRLYAISEHAGLESKYTTVLNEKSDLLDRIKFLEKEIEEKQISFDRIVKEKDTYISRLKNEIKVLKVDFIDAKSDKDLKVDFHDYGLDNTIETALKSKIIELLAEIKKLKNEKYYIVKNAELETFNTELSDKLKNLEMKHQVDIDKLLQERDELFLKLSKLERAAQKKSTNG
ncbi:MAG: TIR domain-containing protein [Saprospiraceae bacterium]|nr:TIR domain-containing protein [Saprospiraceae bacterium]